MPRRPAPPEPEDPLLFEAYERAELIKEELRLEIRRRGLVERDLSRRLGFASTFLANLFHGAAGGRPVGLRVETLLAILAHLELPAAEFLLQVEERYQKNLRKAGRAPQFPAPLAATPGPAEPLAALAAELPSRERPAGEPAPRSLAELRQVVQMALDLAARANAALLESESEARGREAQERR